MAYSDLRQRDFRECDFFQEVPEELPQEDLTAWYLRNFGRIINTDCAKMAFMKDGYMPYDPEQDKVQFMSGIFH